MMDPPDPEPTLTPVLNKNTKRELICNERQRIVSRLMFELQERGVDGKLLRRTLKLMAGEFHVCPRTMTRVWAHASQQNYENPLILQFRSSPQSPEKEVWEIQKVEP